MHRVLKPGGICIVSVPNLASWVNKLLLLLGIQPLGVEIGTESISYGFPLAKAREHLDRFSPAGHVRAFTPLALQDIVESTGFKTLGWWNQDPWHLLRMTSCSGRAIGVIAGKP